MSSMVQNHECISQLFEISFCEFEKFLGAMTSDLKVYLELSNYVRQYWKEYKSCFKLAVNSITYMPLDISKNASLLLK